MKLITISDLYRWSINIRYDDVRLKRLLRGRPGWTPLEFVDEEDILPEDRVWVLLRSEVLGKALSDVGGAIVERAVRHNALTCGISSVEDWAERWLNGDDEARSKKLAERAVKTTWATNWEMEMSRRTAGEELRPVMKAKAKAARAAWGAADAAVAWASGEIWGAADAAVTWEEKEDSERAWKLGIIREDSKRAWQLGIIRKKLEELEGRKDG